MSRGPPTNRNGHEQYNPYIHSANFPQPHPSTSQWHPANSSIPPEQLYAPFPGPGLPAYPAQHLSVSNSFQGDFVLGSVSPSPVKKLKLTFNSILSAVEAPAEPSMVATRGRASNGHQEQRQAMVEASGSDFDEDAIGEEEESVSSTPQTSKLTTSRGRQTKRQNYADDDFEDAIMPSSDNGRRRSSRPSRRESFVVHDEEEDDESEDEEVNFARSTRTRGRKPPAKSAVRAFPARETRHNTKATSTANVKPERLTRTSRRTKVDPDDEEDYEENLNTMEIEADMELGDDAVPEAEVLQKSPIPKFRSTPPTSESPPPRRNTARDRRLRASRRSAVRDEEGWAVEDEEEESQPRQLRKRNKEVNYTIPPPLEDMPTSKDKGKGRQHSLLAGLARGVGSARGRPMIPWGASGRDLGKALGEGSSSDSDDPRTPHKKRGLGGMSMPGFSATGSKSNVLGGAGGGGSGAPDNFGRVNPKSALADTDPLGIDPNVTFDNVGGLDDHINQLKEMVALPLLYPELFLRFGVTPPRGVLFHGPPGTGKTLLARALAASCSTGDTKISFFMRKGADCLSKWVGEAERQLRMLFEEARNSQPSIIFFDEIDGLAPVRSSKQEQIHASIVSTLLALMDGMDGRGQVIIIGATNRPDAVDPALRRPGRFDREFYFPLPNRVARKKILSINTKVWDPPLEDNFLEQLSMLTKGYGGADLRALCTEASLNAIQRRYPQIYKSSDRLLLDPKTIQVQAKDFMIAAKKMVPSSARATASAAVPLPTQLVPLLSMPLEQLKAAVDRALPPVTKRSVLEEAEYEDEDDGTSFAKEVMLQSLETLRVYRPRVLLHGQAGFGQTYLGPAILHHLEGYHVQSFDLATLMSDSTRTIEAAIVQLFIEAKRHKPAVLFFPALTQWSYAVSDVARSTVTAMLEGIAPSDSVLLLAIVDGDIEALPTDVQAWFGHTLHNRLLLTAPGDDQRATFFSDLLDHVKRSPAEFPDAVPRKRRVLEILPKAPPLPPRKLTEAELAAQEAQDSHLRDVLKLSLIPILQELQKTYKKVAKMVLQDSFDVYTQLLTERGDAIAEAAAVPSPAEGIAVIEDGVIAGQSEAQATNPNAPAAQAEAAVDIAARFPVPRRPHKVDLDTINRRLYRDCYLTPQDMLDDLECIVENAEALHDHDRVGRLKQMTLKAKLAADSFEPQWKADWERAAARERTRREAAAEAAAAAEKAASPTEPSRHSARAEGKEPEVSMTDPSALERSLKRHRSQDLQGVSELSSKRQKNDDVEMGSAETADADQVAILDAHLPLALLSHNGQLEAVPASQEAERLIAPVPPVVIETPEPPLPATSLPAGLGPDSHSAAANIPTPPEDPPEPPPPFEIPASAMQDLESSYKVDTADLNIEQLEQLRAMSLDVIWRSRAKWNRTAMVGELREQLTRFISEVRPSYSADEEEEYAM